ncbi:MAG: hypothetical protein DRP64_13675 [Verrucomicrobia bacterium]|nr:MAG: hypothetical protein DRP64_13675 [Verrucomicrobiota bacterium]
MENLRFFEKTCDEFKTWDEFDAHFHSLSNDDQSRLLLAYNFQFIGPSSADRDSPQNYKESVAWFKTVRRDIETGLINKYPRIRKHLNLQERLAERWKLLHFICMRLESIAHKQLRGADFSEIDNSFIQNYGKILAHLMFYDGNSYLHPRDDAPKIMDVYSNLTNTEKHLHVGVARARKMYVLYPWQGKTVLCEGAVMPYYEFTHTTRLNDADWKTMLDSRKRPAIPNWFNKVLDDDDLSVFEFKK